MAQTHATRNSPHTLHEGLGGHQAQLLPPLQVLHNAPALDAGSGTQRFCSQLLLDPVGRAPSAGSQVGVGGVVQEGERARGARSGLLKAPNWLGTASPQSHQAAASGIFYFILFLF